MPNGTLGSLIWLTLTFRSPSWGRTSPMGPKAMISLIYCIRIMSLYPEPYGSSGYLVPTNLLVRSPPSVRFATNNFFPFFRLDCAINRAIIPRSTVSNGPMSSRHTSRSNSLISLSRVPHAPVSISSRRSKASCLRMNRETSGSPDSHTGMCFQSFYS